jgi:RHS repeat-associated protein
LLGFALCAFVAWALSPKRRVRLIWTRMACEELWFGVSTALRSGKVRWALALGLAVTQVSLYAPDAHAVTRTANYTDDQRFYYHLDHMGGTKFITNFEGMVHARRYYTPFGEQLYPPGMDGSLQNNLSFDGKELDRAQIPELYHFGARAYDPTFGRFMSTDTMVKQPFNPAGLNRLAFAANNPLRFADPTGHSFWDVLAGVLVVVLVVAAAAVISIATLGAGAPISAILIGATIGAVVAGGVAVGLAAAGKIDSFWEGAGFALAGAIIGASAVGAYLAGAAAASSSGWTAFAYNTLGGALAGGATGGLSGMVQAAANQRFDLMLSAFLNGYLIGAALGAVSGALGGSTARALGFDTQFSLGGAGPALPEFVTVLLSLGGGAIAGVFGSVNVNKQRLGLNAPKFLLVTTDPDAVASSKTGFPSGLR